MFYIGPCGFHTYCMKELVGFKSGFDMFYIGAYNTSAFYAGFHIVSTVFLTQLWIVVCMLHRCGYVSYGSSYVS